MFFKPDAQGLVDQALDDRADFGGHQFVLGLRRELGIGDLNRQHSRQALSAIVARERHLLLLGDAGTVGIGGDLTRERGTEAGHMRAAVTLRNVVGEAQHVLVIAVVPPHGHLYGDAVLLASNRDRLLHERFLRPVEIGDEGLEATVIHQFLTPDVRMTLVGQHDADAGIQEGEFAQAMLEPGELEFDVRKGLFARREGHLRPGVAAGVARHFERPVGNAVGEAHFVDLARTANLELQRHGKGVDDRNADAVQTAGDLVGILVEFPAGMKLRHDDFRRRDALFPVNVGRYTAAVVGHGYGAVGVERHRNQIRVPCQSLVDRVVHDFVDHVVQT